MKVESRQIAHNISGYYQQQVSPFQTLSMMWQAPTVYRGGQTAASHIDMNGETEGRVRFAMKGATPFKGNFIAYYDFKSVSTHEDVVHPLINGGP